MLHEYRSTWSTWKIIAPSPPIPKGQINKSDRFLFKFCLKFVWNDTIKRKRLSRFSWTISRRNAVEKESPKAFYSLVATIIDSAAVNSFVQRIDLNTFWLFQSEQPCNFAQGRSTLFFLTISRLSYNFQLGVLGVYIVQHTIRAGRKWYWHDFLFFSKMVILVLSIIPSCSEKKHQDSSKVNIKHSVHKSPSSAWLGFLPSSIYAG